MTCGKTAFVYDEVPKPGAAIMSSHATMPDGTKPVANTRMVCGSCGQSLEPDTLVMKMTAAGVTIGAAEPVPCIMCGVPYADHASYPSCCDHPYTTVAAIRQGTMANTAAALLALQKPAEGWTLNTLLGAVETATWCLTRPNTDGLGGGI